MTFVPDRLSRAFPFNTPKPFDRHTDSLISYRRAAARRLSSAPLHRIVTRSPSLANSD